MAQIIQAYVVNLMFENMVYSSNFEICKWAHGVCFTFHETRKETLSVLCFNKPAMAILSYFLEMSVCINVVNLQLTLRRGNKMTDIDRRHFQVYFLVFPDFFIIKVYKQSEGQFVPNGGLG